MGGYEERSENKSISNLCVIHRVVETTDVFLLVTRALALQLRPRSLMRHKYTVTT